MIGWDRTQPVDVLSCCANHCATGHLMHLNAIGAFALASYIKNDCSKIIFKNGLTHRKE